MDTYMYTCTAEIHSIVYLESYRQVGDILDRYGHILRDIQFITFRRRKNKWNLSKLSICRLFQCILSFSIENLQFPSHNSTRQQTVAVINSHQIGVSHGLTRNTFKIMQMLLQQKCLASL